MRDHRDDVIQALADSEAELRGWLTELTAEIAVWRLITERSLERSRRLSGELARLRDTHYRLLREFRALREGRAGVAA